MEATVFAGTSVDIVNYLLGSLKKSLNSERGSLWLRRMSDLVTSLTNVMVYNRDKHGIEITFGALLTLSQLDEVVAISLDEKLPEDLRSPIRQYLVSMPGFTWLDAKNKNLCSEAYRQNAYFTTMLYDLKEVDEY
jgi:hypothetical protein